MVPMKGAPKGVALPAQVAYVDPFVSSTSPQTSLPSQQDDIASGTPLLSDRLSSMLPEERFENHPLFRGGRSVIPGMDKSEPWMRRNAIELLSLHAIEEIAKGDLGARFVVGAIMSSTLTEMRGVELREFGYSKTQNECLLLIERRHSKVQFLKVDAEGLPAAQAKWFESLPLGHVHSPNESRFIHRSKFLNEVSNQGKCNEAVFRSFYGAINGRDPASFTRLHAWVMLDSGRITYVDEFGGRPRARVPGLRTEFSATIVGGAAHVSCTNRQILYGMPSVYLAYFMQPFIKIRDVVSSVEEGVPEEGQGGPDSDAVSSGLLR